MALNSQYSNTARSAALAALCALANGGKLRAYDGVQAPNANTAPSGNVLLCEWTLANPAFGAPVNGVATANPIASASVLAAGTATWFRIVEADGTTVVMDGTIGTAAANLILGAVIFATPAVAAIYSLTVTDPSAGA